MKSCFLLLMMVLAVGFVNGTQPVRKPFIQITVDGKPSKNGDVLIVKPGQKLLVSVELEGGRRDYCKFPDTYADIAGKAQILSRGNDGITYQIDGKNAEWKLVNEETHFSADEYLQINTANNQPKAEIIVSSKKFPQSYLKIKVLASWQFTQDDKITKEENVAEGTLYFKVAGESDIWFASRNIEASGIKNELVEKNLTEIQLVCDSIEKSFHRLNFSTAQQSIRDLQNSINTLKSTIDEVIAANPAYRTKILFMGLPSDHPFNDISVFLSIKNNWMSLQTLLADQKQQLGKLSTQFSDANKNDLSRMIGTYVDWQSKLPEKTFETILSYIPDFKADNVRISEIFRSKVDEITESNYQQTIDDFNAFLDQRTGQIPGEIQQISVVSGRLQAVKLFDGMLRSYFSSINWADWKDSRE